MSGLVVAGKQGGPTRTDPICGYRPGFSWASQAQTSSFLRPCQRQQPFRAVSVARFMLTSHPPPLSAVFPHHTWHHVDSSRLPLSCVHFQFDGFSYSWVCFCHLSALFLEEICCIVGALPHCERNITPDAPLSTIPVSAPFHPALTEKKTSIMPWPAGMSPWKSGFHWPQPLQSVGGLGSPQEQSDLVTAPPAGTL